MKRLSKKQRQELVDILDDVAFHITRSPNPYICWALEVQFRKHDENLCKYLKRWVVQMLAPSNTYGSWCIQNSCPYIGSKQEIQGRIAWIRWMQEQVRTA